MILGIGIDSVEIDRFTPWSRYSHTMLRRIFSPEEIAYCISIEHKAAQRFAIRFAAREALYKALAYTQNQPPFLQLCKAVGIARTIHGAPQLIIDWYQLPDIQPAHALISLSHTRTIATALVLLQTSAQTSLVHQI